MSKICCTCLKRFENADAPVLAMGAYGTPKLLCPNCADLVEKVTLSREYDEIAESMNAITDTMSKANVDDRVTVETMTELLKVSAERAQKIKLGEYDFALDEENDEDEDSESFDDIPEELQETEEDRLLDEEEAEKLKKFDRVLNWLWIGVGIGVAVMIVIKVIQLFN